MKFADQGTPLMSITQVAKGKKYKSMFFMFSRYLEAVYTLCVQCKVRHLFLVSWLTSRVVDTGRKFATGVAETGGILPPALVTPAANLPPVSLMYTGSTLSPALLTPVANLPPVSLTLAALCRRCC
jgi:hypothetical protein